MAKSKVTDILPTKKISLVEKRVEEIKDRYYSVSKAILEIRGEKDHVLVQKPFDYFTEKLRKENIEKLKGLQLMEQENNLTEEVFNIAQVAIEKEAALAIVKAESNEENANALLRQNKELEKRIKSC